MKSENLNFPNFISRSDKKEPVFDLYSHLLAKRIIFLRSELTDETANEIIAQLLFLAAEDSEQDIFLYINSSSGSVTGAIAIYDTIQQIHSDVCTVCVPYLKRMDDQRPVIVLEEKIAYWQGCYGYVENVAYAIALAVNDEKAKGRIYNVAELPGSTVADLVKAIAKIVGWQGEVVILPKTQMPATWKFEANFDQHWVTDSTRIRTELGYTEIVSKYEALKRTIVWEREHPPEVALEKGHSELLDYKDENVILASLKS